MSFRWDNSYLRELPGNYLRLAPDPAPAPAVLIYNDALGEDLGLGPDTQARAADWFSGAVIPPGADVAALAYAGHQFGGYSPRLGDGRAHLLGEHLDPRGRRWDIQLKGSGRTPFSRGGDGRAAVGPMLREYLISEAMAALGIPTTRSLAVVATGQQIWRDQGALPGAVLTRVAASHIRVGTFQFFGAKGDPQALRALVAHTIRRHDPDLDPNDALGLWDRVMARQARLIAQWMGVGFVHGVMNTDNMALSGETIDYGPCAFVDSYSPGAVFSSIDSQGRYAYANQPHVLGWNLARLAEALLPLFDPDQDRAIDLANERLDGVARSFDREWQDVMAEKLGLAAGHPQVGTLAADLLQMMAAQGADFTLTFRQLTAEAQGQSSLDASLGQSPGFGEWRARWQGLLARDAVERMTAANPVVIPRNHLVEPALQAASGGDLAPFMALLSQVQRPFAPSTGREAFALGPPSGFGDYVTFCGT